MAKHHDRHGTCMRAHEPIYPPYIFHHLPFYCRIAKHRSCLIRKAFKMPARHNRDHLLHSLMKRRNRSAVPAHARAGRHQRCERLQRSQARYLIIWSLRQTHYATQRHRLVLIARSLSAPWCSVYHCLAIKETHNRIVVIEQICVSDMIEP